MSFMRPFSRVAARTGSSCPSCVRTFASSTPRADEPKRSDVFGGLLESLKATSDRARPRAAPYQRTTTRTLPFNSQESGVARNDPHKLLEQTARDLRRNRQDEAAMTAAQETVEYERQMTRRWRDGDVYAPHDLSGVEMAKWSKGQPKGRPKKDVFDMLKINPLNHYWNFAMMSEFMTELGKIKHSKDTGLRPVNQRKVAKAVRRAIGLGLMPSVHRHPEILQPRNSLGR
ncbi:ribosomal protein S18, partial [Aureobasidium sp. EXF-3399]